MHQKCCRPFAGEGARATRAHLVSADSEADSCPDVCSQRRVSHNLLIGFVESVLQIQVRRDPGGHRVPSAQIYASIAGSVIDAVAQEIRIWPSADETSAEIGPPPVAQVSQQQASGVLRTPDQGLSRCQ